MTVALGKRKRRTDAEKPQKSVAAAVVRRESSESSDGETAKALFRRAFEAKFKPLEKVERPKLDQVQGDEDDDDGSHSDWDGLSEEEEAVEIVRHVLPDFSRSAGIDSGKKAFMVGNDSS